MLLEKYSLAVGSAFQISRQMDIIIFTIMEKTVVIRASLKKIGTNTNAKSVLGPPGLESLVNQLTPSPKSANFCAIVGLLRVSFLIVTF